MARRQLTEKQVALREEYVKEMRKANQRLRELEKLAKNPDYKNVLNYAYRVAERDVKTLNMMGESGKVRYKIPTNTNRLESALRRVKKFNYGMVTTTKRDIDKYYVKNTENFNKNFGTNFTWQELRHFTKASNWDTLKAEYGSSFLQTVIQSHQKEKGVHIADDVAKVNENVKTISEDAVVSEVSQILAKDGLRFDLLDSATGEYYQEDFEEENPFI